MYKIIILFLILVNVSGTCFSQSKKYRSQKDAAIELSKSLEYGKSDEVLAQDYEKLAKELLANQEYSKAEENYLKAKNIYQKRRENEKVAFVEREIAKLKESQNKINEAIKNYQSASQISNSKDQKMINESDAQRLLNSSNTTLQSRYVNQKIEILEEKKASGEEISEAYQQMAKINMQQDEPEKAISNYEKAIQKSDRPEEEVRIGQKIAHVYLLKEQEEKAIELNEQLVQKTKELDDPHLEIDQLKKLSSTYFNISNEKKGLESLIKAYELALQKGYTMEANEMVELLAEYYKKNNRPKEALNIYYDFSSKLPSLLQSDSSLVDAQIYQINEDKVVRLEKEKELQGKLIKKQTLLNNVLIIAIILIIAFLFFIVNAWLAIRKKNKKIALQSLRREMNPHFIFNSLNSVNQFIAENNELEANKYLSSYSRLMRNIMENSNKDFVPLSLELEHVREYLELENRRFTDKFAYFIEVAEFVDADSVLVPNMLIQPQLENAIWHGLRYRKDKGYLFLRINKKENRLFIEIEDNGIGIKESKKIKTTRQKEHTSRGLLNTYERINLLNNLYNTTIRMEIKEKGGDDTGVLVIIKMTL